MRASCTLPSMVDCSSWCDGVGSTAPLLSGLLGGLGRPRPGRKFSLGPTPLVWALGIFAFLSRSMGGVTSMSWHGGTPKVGATKLASQGKLLYSVQLATEQGSMHVSVARYSTQRSVSDPCRRTSVACCRGRAVPGLGFASVHTADCREVSVGSYTPGKPAGLFSRSWEDFRASDKQVDHGEVLGCETMYPYATFAESRLFWCRAVWPGC